MQLVEEEGKEFFCQVHGLKQLKGSVSHQDQHRQEEGTHAQGQGNQDVSLASLPQIISPQACCRIAE